MTTEADRSPDRRHRLRLRRAIAVGLPLLVGSAAVVIIDGSRPAATGTRALPPATATVVRATLTETETVDGTLGYGQADPLTNRLPGTVTSTAAAGTVVGRGQPLYSVDELPVVLLYGSVPAYRPLRPGVVGDDVRQLEENLRELGYAGFTADHAYTAATAGAVVRWQRDLRLPQTGEVELGRVVFLPGAVRIAGVALRAGQVADPGATVLNHTSTARIVTAAVDSAQLPMVSQGASVTVTLPGRSQVPAEVASVGSVASSNGTAQPGGLPEAQSPGDASQAATFTVTFAIADQGALGTIEGAPVTVALTGQRHDGVLAVPVAALLALREGGYGVQIVVPPPGSTTRIVRVQTGLFAGGLVEVSGPDIAEGTVVGVPPP